MAKFRLRPNKNGTWTVRATIYSGKALLKQVSLTSSKTVPLSQVMKEAAEQVAAAKPSRKLAQDSASERGIAQ